VPVSVPSVPCGIRKGWHLTSEIGLG